MAILLKAMLIRKNCLNLKIAFAVLSFAIFHLFIFYLLLFEKIIMLFCVQPLAMGISSVFFGKTNHTFL
jgi:hypothetical protein